MCQAEVSKSGRGGEGRAMRRAGVGGLKCVTGGGGVFQKGNILSEQKNVSNSWSE